MFKNIIDLLFTNKSVENKQQSTDHVNTDTNGASSQILTITMPLLLDYLDNPFEFIQCSKNLHRNSKKYRLTLHSSRYKKRIRKAIIYSYKFKKLYLVHNDNLDNNDLILLTGTTIIQDDPPKPKYFGATGATGPIGCVGPTGAVGFIGARGFNGYSSATGFNVYIGPTGYTGPTGPTSNADASDVVRR